MQTNFKIQKLIENQESVLPSSKERKPKILPLPFASPLLILTKSSFWDDLLKVYFQVFHGVFPILSITNFNPQNAPYHLLSAMYYLGYKYQPNQPEELTFYMDSYAKTNLKLIIRKCSSSAIQALLIYQTVYFYQGNASLSHSCRAHATRIGYALGIHLDSKIFSELDNYTRRLVLVKIRDISTYEVNFGNLSKNYLTDFGLYRVDPEESKWQLLNQRTIIHYGKEAENILYAECCTHIINYSIELKYHMFSAPFIEAKKPRFKSEWNKLRKTITNIYQKYIRVYYSLSLNCLDNLKIVKGFELLVKVEYHFFMIEFYGTLKNQLGELGSGDLKEVLYHCDYLLKLVLDSIIPSFIAQILIYMVGYRYLDVYNLCTAADRLLIQKNLTFIIRVISYTYLPSTSLNFLILKNGYKSIINNNIDGVDKIL